MTETTDYKVKYESLFIEHLNLRHRLAQLERLVFGSKHERFVPTTSPEQLSLGLPAGEVKPAEVVAVEKIEYTRKKKQSTEKINTGRMKLPADLPREQVILEPDEDVTGYIRVGEEVTEELDPIPGKLFVRQYLRPKYARPEGAGVVIAELPARPIDKGIPGPGLLAQIVIDKYTDHLPVHRQLQRFGREGIKLASSTLGDWISGTCALLEPLYEALKREVLSSDYLQADETPIKVLDKDKKGTTHRGYHWVYHAPLKRIVLFDYREGRGREGPQECLKNFKGWLQTDGYTVYEQFNTREVTLLHCMAHVRRKFDEARDNDAQRSAYALTEIQKLYAIEREIRDQSHSERFAARQSKSLLILDELKSWMLENYKAVVPRSPIGMALHYALERWDKLMLYINDGKLEIDNNLVENAIRPVAVGRKNYLFAGSHNGAQRAAMLYSFLGTCKINDVNPFEWLRMTLDKIPNYPINRIAELLPRKM